MSQRARNVSAVLIAGGIGGAFFAWIAGWRVISPTSIAWVMKLDWQHHFIAWHFFRDEPWQYPPGLISTYYAPIGTAIGFTDSVPLAALTLKPFSSLLPHPFQFLGGWLLVCFVLQGMVGASITQLWTRNVALQVAGGVLFLLVPTLLERVGHVALTSHFLLLASLWLYFREATRPASLGECAALGLIAGLIHPYLAVMALAVVVALSLRRLMRDHTSIASKVRSAALPVFGCLAGLIAGWWTSGLLSIPGASDLISVGLSQYSMNVLSPIAPAGWSLLLPEVPLANEFQSFEGFQYLGAGLLALLPVAVGLVLWRRDWQWRTVIPLTLVCAISAVYALSPRVTVGSRVLIDLTSPALERLAVFRVTGRFFWPAAYAIVAFLIWAVVTRLRPAAALAVLSAAIGLQLLDVGAHYETVRTTAHSDAFHAWPQSLQSPLWRTALPHYRRLLMYPPEQCGPAPMPYIQPAFLAANFGLSINTGHPARANRAARRAYCQQLGQDWERGVVADDAVYLLSPAWLQLFRDAARQPVICTDIDRMPVCVTEASYAQWRPDAVR